jgi:hypothetical protein
MNNTTLVPYGIREEVGTIRAHVSVVSECVYVFPAGAAIALIDSGKYKQAPAKTGNIVTAKGYLIPPNDIPGIRTIPLPSDLMGTLDFRQTDSTSQKGDKAVRAVCYLLKIGCFPLSITGEEVADANMQISGTDILINLKTRIQVKCDWRAGPGPNGTGNLFIQTEECNPYGYH